MEDIKKVDARGLSCPQPALLTRRALSSLSGGRIQVLVDSASARDNVARTAEKAGWSVAVLDEPDGGFRLAIMK